MDINKEKLDIVYLYVDGNDKEWLQKKNLALKESGGLDDLSAHECRFNNNDELKYSLRSVEKYANWINHIYIITDNQVPNWLNLSNERISIIDHKDIIPADALPTFNSLAIESCIHNIPNLSELFLCANDDTFFADYVTPEFFFKKDGYPICRLKRNRKNLSDLYSKLLVNASNLIEQSFGKKYSEIPHHSIDAYKKSTWEACQKCFSKNIRQVIYSKFRNEENCERVLYTYYALATKQGHYKKVSKIDSELPLYTKFINFILKKYKQDSICITIDDKRIREKYYKLKPSLCCFNDKQTATDTDRERVIQFYNELFPSKSEFELQ